MRKTQFALAAVALIASTAAMAEVTIGGYVDAGVQNAPGKKTQLTGGGLDINNLRFSASEDIDGIKVGAFALIRFESTTGALTRPGGNGNTATENAALTPAVTGATPAGNGTLFEIAHVNVSSGSFGTVELGRTVDSFWGNGVAGYDVTGGSNLGSAVGSVLNLKTSKVFVDNSVHYVSPSIGGLTVASTYVFNTSTSGSTIGFANKGDFSATANYVAGPLSVGAGSMKSDLTKGWFVGGGYDLGVAKVNVVYQDATAKKSYGVNAAVPLSGALTATAGYYKDSGNGTFLVGKGSSTQVGLIYGLSKRTRVYANYQHTTDAMGVNIGLSSPGASGAVGNSVTVGVGHSF